MTRPWVTPQEVKAYSDIADVQNRDNERLKVDISRAEQRVIAVTHNDFSAEEYAAAMPSQVKTAVILLAERYAVAAVNQKKTMDGAYESETFDDYSYKKATGVEIDESDLDLASLLEDYIITIPKGTLTMRMRKL